MQEFALQLQFTLQLIQNHLPTLLFVLGIIWAVNIINWMLRGPLFFLGLVPRTVHGIIGIACAPVLHKNFTHLFYNSIPWVLLSCGVLVMGWNNYLHVTVTIILLSGVLTWLLARPGNHIGASGLIMGYWAYLLGLAYWVDSGLAVIVGIIAIYYFGSLAANLIPTEQKVSWEGHVFGFIAGLTTAYLQFSLHFHLPIM